MLQRRLFPVMALLLLACGLRLGWIALNYTPDLSRFQNGDYTLYAIGGAHILDQHDLSNSLFLVRPPLFPLLIAGVGGSALAGLIVNALIGGLAAPLTLILARRSGVPPPWALVAGLIVAVDPPSLVYSAYLGAEALANTLLLLALVALVIGVDSPRGGLWWGIGAGIALVLSAWARPASYLLWIPLGIGLVIAHRQRWRMIVAFVLVSAAGIGLWMAHNAAVFGNSNFSTIGVYNLLYYRAASVEHQATGQDLDSVYIDLSTRVEARLGHDTSGIDAGTRQGHYAATAPLHAAMTAVALDVFRAYPLAYVYTLPIGAARI